MHLDRLMPLAFGLPLRHLAGPSSVPSLTVPLSKPPTSNSRQDADNVTSPALVEAEALLQQVFYASPLGTALLDLSGSLLRVNAALCDLLGYTEDEMLRLEPWEFTHVDDVDPENDFSALAVQGKIDGYRQAKRLIAKDGHVVEVMLTLSLVRDPQGTVLYGVGVVEDRTRVRQAMRDLDNVGRRLALAMGAAHMSTWDIDLVTGSISVSPNFSTDFGVPPPTTIGEALELIHPDDRGLLLRRNDETGRDFDCVVRAQVSATGTIRWIQTRGLVLSDDEGSPMSILGVVFDVTEGHAGEERRRAADRAYRTVIETSVDAFVGMDAAGRVTDWNSAAEAMFGWMAVEAIGRPLHDLIVPPELRHAHLAAVSSRLASTTASTAAPVRREVTALRRDGSLFPAELSITGVTERGEIRFKGFIRDQTESKLAEETLRAAAVTDPLTGLANRTLLLTRVADSLRRPRLGGILAVLFIDIDRFKLVNDTLGHDFGDRLLIALSDRLRSVVRFEDTLARVGGDEFVMTGEVEDEESAGELAQRVVTTLSERVQLGGRDLFVDVSIGVALSTSPDDRADTLIRDADMAMYEAKHNPGRAWRVFGQSLRDKAIARLEVEAELRVALDKGQLQVHYQPIVLRDGSPVAVEALARWMHPTRGMVAPEEFIPVSEESGLVVPLGEFVLERACRDLAAWRAAAPEWECLTVSVNISGIQLADPGLTEYIRSRLERHSLPASALCLEVTESVFVGDTTTEATALVALHGLGVRLAVDDFGTGYSSLLSLRHFPVSELKLDRKFVAGLGSEGKDTAIVASVIQLAHSLGLESVAEGVETAQQFAALQAMGCDRSQGFLWSTPVAPADVLTTLAMVASASLEAPHSSA